MKLEVSGDLTELYLQVNPCIPCYNSPEKYTRERGKQLSEDFSVFPTV